MRSIVVAAFAVLALLLAGAATSGAAAPKPTLIVVTMGGGGVTSKPAGISCPGRCTATFAAGTSVVLTPKAKKGTPFLRWGGSCIGSGACRVAVSSLAVVGAQFASGAKAVPQATAQKSVAAPGPYSGADNGSISFYVSLDSKSMLNISVPLTSLSCSPSGGIQDDHFAILKVAIRPNGSFSATTSQHGLLSGIPVKFSYNIAGRFQAATASTAAGAAGTWREDIAYASGVAQKCTSNAQSWTAALVREPAQQKLLVLPGNYSGPDVGDIRFSVAGANMLNISVPLTALNCSPSGAIQDDHFAILKVAIKRDGSFTATSSQNGVLNSTNAKITYTFAGYFEGPTPAGAATVSGLWREDVLYASGTTTLCTSNDQFWRASRVS